MSVQNNEEFLEFVKKTLTENVDAPMMVVIEKQGGILFLTNIASASLQFGMMDSAKMMIAIRAQKAIEQGIAAADAQQVIMANLMDDGKKPN